ncbi:MAG TPA: hypothetical protein VFC03_07310, partial [Acidimicrobiales bacterium]|nr:hypothetical protein [Acidimicrobiales bacterium]
MTRWLLLADRGTIPGGNAGARRWLDPRPNRPATGPDPVRLTLGVTLWVPNTPSKPLTWNFAGASRPTVVD